MSQLSQLNAVLRTALNYIYSIKIKTFETNLNSDINDKFSNI